MMLCLLFESIDSKSPCTILLIIKTLFLSPQNATMIHFPLKGLCFLLPLTRSQPTPRNLAANLHQVNQNGQKDKQTDTKLLKRGKITPSKTPT